jgi:uncharacterized protein (TIGR02145 family)
MSLEIVSYLPAIFFAMLCMVMLFLEHEYINKYTQSPLEALSESAHPRADELYEFVISTPENKIWYLKNLNQINLIEDGIQIQGLKFCLDNEQAKANGQGIWNHDGHTFFSFNAAQRYVAEQGKRLLTNEEWQELVEFLPEEQELNFFTKVLKIPLVGFVNANTSSYSGADNYAYLWTSSALDTKNAYYRTLIYDNTTVYSAALDKSNGLSVRCVKS